MCHPQQRAETFKSDFQFLIFVSRQWGSERNIQKMFPTAKLICESTLS